MKKTLSIGVIFLIILTSIAFQSCYNYHVVPASVTPATEYKDSTYYYFFWGLYEPKIPPADCHKNGLADVEVKSKFSYSLLTIVTLGIVHPVEIRWKCHQCMIIE